MTEEQAALAADLTKKIRIIDEIKLPTLQEMLDKLTVHEATLAKVILHSQGCEYAATVEQSFKIVKMLITDVQNERQDLISRLEHI